MPRRRFAVALLVPAPVAAEVDGLRRACGDANLRKIAPHATLVPPINLREEDLDGALAVVRDAAADCPPLRLTLGPATTFEPARSVLYLAVGGPDADRLQGLQASLVAGPLERPPQHDSFVPHVTVSIGAGRARVAAGIAALADYRAEVVVPHVHVLENTRDDGLDLHVWRPVADAALGGRSVVGRGGLELELTVSTAAEPEAKAWSEPLWERSDREDIGDIGEEATMAITARRGEQVVGLLEGWFWADLGHVDDLMVAEGARGEGIGRHLLARFEAEARARGCTSLALRTPAGSKAEGFYGHLGWDHESTQRRWVHGKDFLHFRRWL